MHSDRAFNDILASLEVSGQVLLVEQYRPPWGIDIPESEALAEQLGVADDIRIVAFHIVRRGSFELHTVESEPLVIRSGEVAICTGGIRHRMQDGQPKRVVPFAELLSPLLSPMQAGVGGTTELVCGVFMLRNTERNPLVDALPDILHADVAGRTGGKTLEQLADLLVRELEMHRVGYEYLASRLVELLCAEAIRQYLDTHQHPEAGWFRAMQDPRVGPAINRIHAGIDSKLSVASLAADVNMSPSRFAARFRLAQGEPVMTYVTRWRMNIATRLLRETEMSVEQIGQSVGYESNAAFSRAFSKSIGTSPARFRKAAA